MKFFDDIIRFIQILKKKCYLTNYIDDNLLKILPNTHKLAILDLFIDDFLTFLFCLSVVKFLEDCF
jgi:uncharacterized protein YeeX (DUF496 family)